VLQLLAAEQEFLAAKQLLLGVKQLQKGDGLWLIKAAFPLGQTAKP
jgi:hypothetical protein